MSAREFFQLQILGDATGREIGTCRIIENLRCFPDLGRMRRGYQAAHGGCDVLVVWKWVVWDVSVEFT